LYLLNKFSKANFIYVKNLSFHSDPKQTILLMVNLWFIIIFHLIYQQEKSLSLSAKKINFWSKNLCVKIFVPPSDNFYRFHCTIFWEVKFIKFCFKRNTTDIQILLSLRGRLEILLDNKYVSTLQIFFLPNWKKLNDIRYNLC